MRGQGDSTSTEAAAAEKSNFDDNHLTSNSNYIKSLTNKNLIKLLHDLNTTLENFNINLNNKEHDNSVLCTSDGDKVLPDIIDDNEDIIFMLTSLQRNLKQLMIGFTSFEAQLDFELLSSLIEKLDSVLERTLLVVQLLIEKVHQGSSSESVSMYTGLGDVMVQLVTLLNSSFVRKLCQSNENKSHGIATASSSFVPSCVKFFKQLMIYLTNLTLLIPSNMDIAGYYSNVDRHSGEDNRIASSSFEEDRLIHLSVDYQLILFIPVLKQLGKLIFCQPNEMNEVLQEVYVVIFDAKDKCPKRFGLLVKAMLELFHEQMIHQDHNEGIRTAAVNCHEVFISWVKGILTGETKGNANEALSYILVYTEYGYTSTIGDTIETQTQQDKVNKTSKSEPKNLPVRVNMTMLQLENLMDADFIHLIKESLVDADLIKRKQSLFILKSIISFIRLNEDLFFDSLNESKKLPSQFQTKESQLIMVSHHFKEFTLFWSTFFELLEIFDEKQIHIIEPCLKKLVIFEDNKVITPHLVLPWYFVLLRKLCYHDNRFLASQGIVHFLSFASKFVAENTVVGNENNHHSLNQVLDFISLIIFPLLKEKVSWIFPAGQDYFKCAKQLGKLLKQVQPNSFETIKFVMTFVNCSCEDKLMSPNCLFIMSTTLCHAVLKGKNVNVSPTDIQQKKILQDLMTCTQHFSKNLKRCLSSLDRFLKVETQKQMMELFCSLILENTKSGSDISGDIGTQLPTRSDLFLTTFDVNNSEVVKLREECMYAICRFIGSLDYTLFCDSPSLLGIRPVLCNFLRTGNSNNILDYQDNLNSATEVCGFLRLYFYKMNDILKSNELKLDPSVLLSEILQFEMSNLSDFLNCVLYTKFLQLNCDTSNAGHLGEINYWNEFIKLFFNYLIKCLSDELLVKKYKYDLNTDFYISGTIDLVHLIVHTLPVQAIKNLNFQDETEQVVKILSGPEFHWGDYIYFDKVQFRLYQIFAKLNEAYNLPRIQKFEISNLVNFFESTDVNIKYKLQAVPSPFRTEFQQLRLTTIIQIISTNPDDDVVKYFSQQDDVWSARWWSSILDLVDESGPQGIIPILDFASTLLTCQVSAGVRFADIRNKILKFTKLSWTHVFEMRKTDAFWIGVEKYLNFIGNAYFSDSGILLETSKDIFEKSERITGLSLTLMTKIASLNPSDLIEGDSKYLYDIVQICTQATYFGPLLLDNHKSTFEIWNYLKQIENGEVEMNMSDYCQFDESNRIEIAPSVFNTNVKSRLLGIQVLIHILNEVKSDEQRCKQVLDIIVTKLLDQNDEESKSKKRYFGDSLTHRVKQRIAQVLLVLQPHFDNEIAGTVTLRLLRSLAGDNPQPSVRYLMEWIVVRNLISYPNSNSFHEFFNASEECCKTRVGFGAFFSTICLHVALNLLDKVFLPNFCDQSLEALSVLLMGQHATVRPYAQACFRRIYQHVHDICPDHGNILAKFSMIHKSLGKYIFSTSEINSLIYKNMENNFYIKIFNPLTHFFAQTIFIYLPKAANLSPDELVQERDLEETFVKHATLSSNNIPCALDRELQYLYQQFEKSSFHLRSALRNGREMGEEPLLPDDIPLNVESAQDISHVYQKKINPWKYLPISQDISDFSKVLQDSKTLTQDGLILVASLVEKLPNLGGLCRTCEIFGVSKYVISSLRYLVDQTFQNLSVSSEKWMNIVEVPKNTLAEFLATYAAKGYTILGIEQASDSISLNSFKFPKKSLILLGHEKFGIPPELLQMVDQCLEIPQVGVTRSLNVHVTGALCVWQYAAQQSLRNMTNLMNLNSRNFMFSVRSPSEKSSLAPADQVKNIAIKERRSALLTFSRKKSKKLTIKVFLERASIKVLPVFSNGSMLCKV